MDLKDRFDLATSGGPSHAPLEERIRLGRNAARRRTTGRALGTIVVAAAVVTGAASLTVGQDRATEPPDPAVASPSPTPTPPPTRTISVASSDRGWAEDEWARMNPGSGEVTVRPGVTVADTLDEPVGAQLSVALDLTRDGERRFALLTRRSGVVASSWDQPDGRTLSQFVEDQVDPQADLPIADGPYALGAHIPLVGYDTGELFTVRGASIVQVIENPITGWCRQRPSAAVEVRYSGKSYFAALGDGNCGAMFVEAGTWDSTLEAAVDRYRATLAARGSLGIEAEEQAEEQADAEQSDGR